MNGLDYLKFLTERVTRNLNQQNPPEQIKHTGTQGNYYNQFFGIIPLGIKIVWQKNKRATHDKTDPDS